MKFRKRNKITSTRLEKVLYMIETEFSVNNSNIDGFYDFVFCKTNKEFNTSKKFVLGNNSFDTVYIKFYSSLKNDLIDYVKHFTDVVDTSKYNLIKLFDLVIIRD